MPMPSFDLGQSTPKGPLPGGGSQRRGRSQALLVELEGSVGSVGARGRGAPLGLKAEEGVGGAGVRGVGLGSGGVGRGGGGVGLAVVVGQFLQCARQRSLFHTLSAQYCVVLTRTGPK